MTETVRTHLRVRASELVGRNWLNTGGKSLDLESLRGKIVLLDFWTFCCINCLHVLDELRPLEQQYSDVLVTVGVHSPKFEHEADPVALAAAVERYEIRHPVLDDPELDTWKAYTARAWPTLVVIDPEGYIVAHLSGEGHADGLAVLIPELIAEHEAKGTLHRGDGPYVAPEPTSGTLRFPGKALYLPAGPRRRNRRRRRRLLAGHGHRPPPPRGTRRTDFQTVLGHLRLRRKGPRRRQRRHSPVQRTAGPGPAAGGRRSGGRLRRRHCRLREPPAARAVARGRNRHARSPATACSGCWKPARPAWTRKAPPYGARLEADPLAVSLSSRGMSSGPAKLNAVVVAMAGVHQIFSFDPLSGAVSIIAGNGLEGLLDGPAAEAWFAQPSGLAEDADGNIWVADSETSALRKLVIDDDGSRHRRIGRGQGPVRLRFPRRRRPPRRGCSTRSASPCCPTVRWRSPTPTTAPSAATTPHQAPSPPWRAGCPNPPT